MARLTLIVRNMWSVSGGFVVSSFRKWSFVRTRTTVALRSLNSISSISGRPFMLHSRRVPVTHGRYPEPPLNVSPSMDRAQRLFHRGKISSHRRCCRRRFHFSFHAPNKSRRSALHSAASRTSLNVMGDAGAVHEDDLPDACLFLQEGRFQPFLARGAGGVGDTAFIAVADPSYVAGALAVPFGYVPFIALARSMLGLDEGHDGVSVELGASIEYVKV